MNPWWYDAFPIALYESKRKPGALKMLTLVSYDISEPRRLSRIAKICEGFGQRVQYSVFECFLEETDLNLLWNKLIDTIDINEDRIVAYRINANSAKQTMTAGTMVCTEKVLCYLV